MNSKEEIVHFDSFYVDEGEDELLVLVDHELGLEVLEGDRHHVLDNCVRQISEPDLVDQCCGSGPFCLLNSEATITSVIIKNIKKKFWQLSKLKISFLSKYGRRKK